MKEKEVRKEVIGLINLIDPMPLYAKRPSLKDLFQLLRTMIGYTKLDLEATQRELKGKK